LVLTKLEACNTKSTILLILDGTSGNGLAIIHFPPLSF
jgi:hypothetical protein